MKATQIIGGITLVIPLVAALYGSMIYVTKLQNTLEQNTMAIELLTKEISNNDSNIHTALSNEVEKLDIRVKGVNELYKQGREEMLIEMTNFAKIIATLEAQTRTLTEGTYKLASQAELRAMEQTYYTLKDQVSQLVYDMKELARKLDGGY
jgi:hypothetical protein